MRVRHTRRAFSDREAIFDYLVSRSPDGARKVLAKINASIATLLEQPELGYRTEQRDIRVKFASGYPDPEHRHTARRPWLRPK